MLASTQICVFISLQDLEFHGVMRFYFQDKAAGNFATKCIRVSSTATTQDVIETLAEKFRPDMRMLSSPKYSLYEVHVSGGLYLFIKSFLHPHQHHIYSQPKYL